MFKFFGSKIYIIFFVKPTLDFLVASQKYIYYIDFSPLAHFFE